MSRGSDQSFFDFGWHLIHSPLHKNKTQRLHGSNALPGIYLDAHTDLIHLSLDFIHVSRSVGKIIISEVDYHNFFLFFFDKTNAGS